MGLIIMKMRSPMSMTEWTRRQFIQRGRQAGAAAVCGAIIPGCLRGGASSNEPSQFAAIPTRAAVHVWETQSTGGPTGRSFTDFFGTQLKGVSEKTVILQSSYLSGAANERLSAHINILRLIARSIRELGARDVVFPTTLAMGADRVPELKVVNMRRKARRQIYCSTRFSGRLRIEVPDIISDDVAIVSVPLQPAAGHPFLACTNLLGLVSEYSTAPPGLEHLNGEHGDLVVDVACTLRPVFAITVSIDASDKIAGARCRLVAGKDLASVDSITCTDFGLDSAAVRPLADLPSWLGPITASQIVVSRSHT
jgi:hypothetical protein